MANSYICYDGNVTIKKGSKSFNQSKRIKGLIKSAWNQINNKSKRKELRISHANPIFEAIYLKSSLIQAGCMKLKIQGLFKDVELWVSISLITVINCIIHLTFAGQLGCYREAWYIIWAGRTQTLGTLVRLFTIDRPIIGPMYLVTYNLLGDNPLHWQIFIFFLKLTCVLGFFLILRKLFPNMKVFTTLAAILLTIYPGFLQLPNAVVYSN